LKEETCAYRQVIERELLQHGMNPFAGIEIGSLAALQRLQCELGLAIVPVAAASPPLAGTILRELRDVDLSLCIGLVRRMDEVDQAQRCKRWWIACAAAIGLGGCRNEVVLGRIANG
jgi:DNA-binding transcriptional LysR family regulator